MRTTVTLDDDITRILRQVMQRTGHSFKDTINQAIRRGLANAVVEPAEPPFVVAPQSMGLRAGIDPARLQELDADLDVEAFLDVTRRLMDEREGRE